MAKCNYCGRYYTDGYRGSSYCSKQCWEADGSPEIPNFLDNFTGDDPVDVVFGTVFFIVGWFIFAYLFDNSLTGFVKQFGWKIEILILAGVSLVQRLLMRRKGCLLQAVIMLLPPVLIFVLSAYNII